MTLATRKAMRHLLSLFPSRRANREKLSAALHPTMSNPLMLRQTATIEGIRAIGPDVFELEFHVTNNNVGYTLIIDRKNAAIGHRGLKAGLEATEGFVPEELLYHHVAAKIDQ